MMCSEWMAKGCEKRNRLSLVFIRQEAHQSSEDQYFGIDLSALQSTVAAGKICVAEMDMNDIEALKCSAK